MTLPHMIYDFAWAACGMFGCFLVLNAFMRRPSARPVIIVLLAMICLCFVFFAHGQAVRTTYPDRSPTVKPQPSFVAKPKIRKRRRNEFRVRDAHTFTGKPYSSGTSTRGGPMAMKFIKSGTNGPSVFNGGFSKADGGTTDPSPYQQPLDVILAHYGFCTDGSAIPAGVPESESQIERLWFCANRESGEPAIERMPDGPTKYSWPDGKVLIQGMRRTGDIGIPQGEQPYNPWRSTLIYPETRDLTMNGLEMSNHETPLFPQVDGIATTNKPSVQYSSPPFRLRCTFDQVPSPGGWRFDDPVEAKPTIVTMTCTQAAQ